MNKFLILSILASWSIMTHADFQSKSFSDLAEMRSASLSNRTVHYVMKNNKFTRKESDIINTFDEMATQQLDKESMGDRLLTIVNFVVSRDIKTFHEESLLDEQDISSMSNIEMKNVKEVGSNTLTFQSILPIPFGSIKSNNTLVVLDSDMIDEYDHIKSMFNVSKYYDNPPELISYQESSNFSSYMDRSQVLTFYYDIGNGKTYIESYTISNLKKDMSWLIKSATKRSALSKIEEIPESCERNGVRWQE